MIEIENIKCNDEKGVTLISLAIAIMLLIILASVATYSGINTVNEVKFDAFATQLKIMQVEVNSLYEDCKNGKTITVGDTEYTGEEILGIGEDITQIRETAGEIFAGANISDKSGYRYFNKETIEGLQIEGIDREFLVNIKTRTVISCRGMEYEGQMYYTMDQLPNGFYKVNKTTENEGNPTFEVKLKKIEESKWRIEIPESSIEYDRGYIKKWKVKYKTNEEEGWHISDNLSFVVDKAGKYSVCLFNENIQSNVEELEITD